MPRGIKMNLFEEQRLVDVCSYLRSGKTITASEISTHGEYPVFGGNGCRGYTTHYNFSGDCAIIGRQGAFCGNVRYFTGNAYMTEHAIIACANNKNNTRYLSYLLSTMNLGRLSGQSAQPGLSVKYLSNVKIFIPSLNIQKKIVSVLSLLDDKIKLNNKINDNLQQQAFALFEQLLLTADDGECSVADIAHLNPKRTLAKNQEAKCIEMSQLSTSGAFPSGWEKRPFNGGMRFSNGDTLLARITPCLENGKAAFIDFLDTSEVAFGSTEYIVLAPKGEIPPEFLYCLARYPVFSDYAVKNMNGSSGRQRVSAETIGQFKLPRPSTNELKRFGNVVSSLFLKMRFNSLENMRLSSLRDSLLPKLMSGELDVSELDI